MLDGIEKTTSKLSRWMICSNLVTLDMIEIEIRDIILHWEKILKRTVKNHHFKIRP